jgi:hypothetical protein
MKHNAGQLSLSLCVCLAVVLFPVSRPAVGQDRTGHDQDVLQTVRETVDASLLDLAERGAFAEPGSTPVTIEAPAEIRYDLGAVIDPARDDSAGLNVLAVLPGSSAQAMGLTAGDRLLSLNGLDLRQGFASASSLREAMAETFGALELVVARGESKLTLVGQAYPVLMPAYKLEIAAPPDGCGRVSTFPGMARSEHLFPVNLRRIDDVEVIRGQADSHRLDGGRHRLMLAELIPPVELNSIEQRQRSQLAQRRLAEFKYFDLDVVPGFTYYLAARLLDPPRDVINNQHWEPVIWRIKKESCR